MDAMCHGLDCCVHLPIDRLCIQHTIAHTSHTHQTWYSNILDTGTNIELLTSYTHHHLHYHPQNCCSQWLQVVYCCILHVPAPPKERCGRPAITAHQQHHPS